MNMYVENRTQKLKIGTLNCRGLNDYKKYDILKDLFVRKVGYYFSSRNAF